MIEEKRFLRRHLALGAQQQMPRSPSPHRIYGPTASETMPHPSTIAQPPETSARVVQNNAKRIVHNGNRVRVRCKVFLWIGRGADKHVEEHDQFGWCHDSYTSVVLHN